MSLSFLNYKRKHNCRWQINIFKMRILHEIQGFVLTATIFVLRSVKCCFLTYCPSKGLEWVPPPRSLWWLLGAQSGWVHALDPPVSVDWLQKRRKRIALKAVHLSVFPLETQMLFRKVLFKLSLNLRKFLVQRNTEGQMKVCFPLQSADTLGSVHVQPILSKIIRLTSDPQNWH